MTVNAMLAVEVAALKFFNDLMIRFAGDGFTTW